MDGKMGSLYALTIGDRELMFLHVCMHDFRMYSGFVRTQQCTVHGLQSMSMEGLVPRAPRLRT
jgi:hypothetical protein